MTRMDTKGENGKGILRGRLKRIKWRGSGTIANKNTIRKQMMKSWLECTAGGLKGQRIDIPDQEFTIGRDPGNDLVLADATVSGRHAAIVFENHRAVLADTSKNGTLVNGTAVKRQVLNNGDIIEIYPFTLTFYQEEVRPEQGTRVLEQSGVNIPLSPPSKGEDSNPHPDPLPKREREKGNQENKEKIPKGRLILYGVLGVGLAGLMAYSFISKRSDQTANDFLNMPLRRQKPERTAQSITPDIEVKEETVTKDPLQLAEEHCKVAENLYRDQTSAQNLYRALLKWEEGFGLLDRMGVKPDYYTRHQGLYQQAKARLEEKVGQHHAGAMVLVKQRDFKGAVELWEKITELVPNQADPRNQEATRMIGRYRRYVK